MSARFCDLGGTSSRSSRPEPIRGGGFGTHPFGGHDVTSSFDDEKARPVLACCATSSVEPQTPHHHRRQHISMVSNRELARQGITLVFDTDAQAATYMADFDARETARKAAAAAQPQPTPQHNDHCDSYANSPRYLIP